MNEENTKKLNQAVKDKMYIGFKVIDVFYDETITKHKRKAICLCDCGKEFILRVDLLNSHRGCKNCGQYYGGIQRVLPDNEAAKRKYYATYRFNAAKRDLIFNLPREDFDKIIAQNCHYCGMSPTDQSYLSKSSKKYNTFFASGVDRLDSKLGYSADNCVPCCSRCNRMKMDLSYTDFISHVLDIREFIVNKLNNTREEWL